LVDLSKWNESFARQTLDAIDGKQARRTDSSSPLGELMDHGICDNVGILFVSIICGALCQLGKTPLFFFFILGGVGSHYCEMWATFLTGQIEFWYVSFTESEVLAMLTHIFFAFFGLGMVKAKIPNTNIRYVEALFYITLCQFALAMFGAPLRVRDWISHQKKNVFEIYSYLAPGIFIIVFSTLWWILSPEVVTLHFVPFSFANGFLMGNACCRLVASRVCKEKPPVFYLVSLGLVVGVINSKLRIVNEEYYVWAYCVWTILAFAHYSVCVSLAFKKVLNINIFTLKKKH